MSDEGATRMAAWIVDHPKSYDNYARIVARALLALDAAAAQMADACSRALSWADGGCSPYGNDEIGDAYDAIKSYRALKLAGQPSADGGKECEHDYEAHDDKGWECKKCGHQT